jgi:hypothetical protein
MNDELHPSQDPSTEPVEPDEDSIPHPTFQVQILDYQSPGSLHSQELVGLVVSIPMRPDAAQRLADALSTAASAGRSRLILSADTAPNVSSIAKNGKH